MERQAKNPKTEGHWIIKEQAGAWKLQGELEQHNLRQWLKSWHMYCILWSWWGNGDQIVRRVLKSVDVEIWGQVVDREGIAGDYKLATEQKFYQILLTGCHHEILYLSLKRIWYYPTTFVAKNLCLIHRYWMWALALAWARAKPSDRLVKGKACVK